MKEKQIEEMANDIAKICPDLVENCCGQINCVTHLTLSLYNAGYRKQSEGEWEKRTYIIFDSEKIGYHCSECNTTWDTPTNYCPYCGAKMKGGAE